jgi:hypothetical protein
MYEIWKQYNSWWLLNFLLAGFEVLEYGLAIVTASYDNIYIYIYIGISSNEIREAHCMRMVALGFEVLLH